MKAKTGLMTGVAVALLLVAGGCSKKVGGQVVAVVNGQEITQQELNAELNGAPIPPDADRKAIQSQLLQQVIDRKLLAAKAKAAGLDKSPAYLAQVQRAQETVLISLLASNAQKGQALPDAAAADRFIAENPSLFGDRKQYQLDQIAFPTTSDPAVLAKLRDAHTMAAIQGALQAAGIPFQSGTGQIDTARIPPDVAKRIAALGANEPFIVPQNGQMVASVIKSVQTIPVPAEQARPAAIELIRRQAVDKAVQGQLKAERASAKIEYGAGFAPPKGASPAAPAS